MQLAKFPVLFVNVPVLLVLKGTVPVGGMNVPGETSVIVTAHEPVAPTLIVDVQLIPVVVARLLTSMLVTALGDAVE